MTDRREMSSRPAPAVFFVSPIGAEESETRHRADLVLRNIVQPAVTEAYDEERCNNLKRRGMLIEPSVMRADEFHTSDAITDRIIQRLRTAHVVIADLSELNANVHYEIGVRHTFCLPTILMADASGQLPFDLSHLNTVKYRLSSARDQDRATAQIVSRIRSIEQWDSPVSRALHRTDDYPYPFGDASLGSADHYKAVDRLQQTIAEVFRSIEGVDPKDDEVKQRWHKELSDCIGELQSCLGARLRIKHRQDSGDRPPQPAS